MIKYWFGKYVYMYVVILINKITSLGVCNEHTDHTSSFQISDFAVCFLIIKKNFREIHVLTMFDTLYMYCM